MPDCCNLVSECPKDASSSNKLSFVGYGVFWKSFRVVTKFGIKSLLKVINGHWISFSHLWISLSTLMVGFWIGKHVSCPSSFCKGASSILTIAWEVGGMLCLGECSWRSNFLFIGLCSFTNSQMSFWLNFNFLLIALVTFRACLAVHQDVWHLYASQVIV